MRRSGGETEGSATDEARDPPAATASQTDGVQHPVVSEELALLADNLARLEVLRPAEVDTDDGLVRELERLRDLLVSREDSKDVAALSDQWHRQSSILRQLRRGRPTRCVDPASPYFAHLRLSEEGQERELYLGRATCLEAGLRIVDWRDAPISKVFYRYGQGDEFEEEIAGRWRAGRIVARRLVQILDRELVRVQAPEGDFVRDAGSAEPGRGAWQRQRAAPARLSGGEAQALRVHAATETVRARLSAEVQRPAVSEDKRLAEITGLIDPEQFELITRPRGFLVIRGAAGSGKTTVALHRVAYLAFEDPAVDSPDTLILMFSEALRRYVSYVLPALGLEQVRVRTYREWVRAQRQRHFRGLPTGHRNDTPSTIQRIKLNPALDRALAHHISGTSGARTWQQAVEDWSTVLTHRGLLEGAFEAATTSGLHGESQGLHVTSRDLDEFIDWNERLVDEVLGHLDGESDPNERLQLDPEDDALLLRAFQRRVGGLMAKRRRRLTYRHVVVDEAQDFSPLEMQVLLGCMGTDAGITLAGDTQQHVSAEGGFTSWSAFFDHLGIDGAEVETLRVSYRSTEEIMRFALAVLGPLREEDEEPETLRSGPPVELFEFSGEGACVAFLTDALRELSEREPLASVALLAPHAATADAYYSALERSEVRRLRRIRAGEFSFSPGIEVTEVEQAKGLEFDYVILLDVSAASYPDRPQDRRRLHVGATRAVHQLWLTSAAPVSPLVREVHLAAR